MLVWLVTLVKLHYKTSSQCWAFSLPCCPRVSMEGLNEISTALSSENIQLLQSEEVVFIKQEFLHKKISSKDVYVDYGAMPWLISQKMQLSSMEI